MPDEQQPKKQKRKGKSRKDQWKMERSKFIKAWIETLQEAAPKRPSMRVFAEKMEPLFIADNADFINAKNEVPSLDVMMQKCKSKCDGINRQFKASTTVEGQLTVPKMPEAAEKPTLKEELLAINGIHDFLTFVEPEK